MALYDVGSNICRSYIKESGVTPPGAGAGAGAGARAGDIAVSPAAVAVSAAAAATAILQEYGALVEPIYPCGVEIKGVDLDAMDGKLPPKMAEALSAGAYTRSPFSST
jgi:hypothetical protein